MLLKSFNRTSVPHFNEYAYSEPLKIKRSLKRLQIVLETKKREKKDGRAVKHLQWAVFNLCTHYFEVFFKNFEAHRQF